AACVPSVPSRLATVTKLRPAGNQMVHAGRKSRFGSNEQTELANLFNRSHAAEQLRGLSINATLIGIGRSLDGFLPQRRVNVAGRDRIHPHTVFSFVDC